MLSRHHSNFNVLASALNNLIVQATNVKYYTGEREIIAVCTFEKKKKTAQLHETAESKSTHFQDHQPKYYLFQTQVASSIPEYS